MRGYWMLNDMHLPRPVSPLAATVLLPAVEAGQQAAFRTYGGPAEARFQVVDGWVYIGFDEAPTNGPPSPAQLAASQAAFATLVARWQGSLLPEVQRLHEQSRSLQPRSASEAARAARHEADILRRLHVVHFETCAPLLGAVLGFEMMLAHAGVPDAGAKVVAMCEGAPNAIGELDDALLELGALAEQDAALAGLVESQDAEGLVAALGAHPGEAGERFRALWPKLRDRPHAVDLFEPTWGEDPTPLLRVLAAGSAGRKQREAAKVEQQARRAAAERDVRAHLPPPMRGPFEGLLAGVRVAWPLMQTHHYWIDELSSGLARGVFLRCAEHLVGRGLADREEVVFLRLDEVVAALEGTPLPAGLVEQRRRERDAHLGVRPPRELGTMPPGLAQDPMLSRFFGSLRASPPGDAVLRGLPASPGKLRGRARVVLGEGELGQLEAGEVLVALTTEPAWTSAMARAGALVAETGGMLCHTAIVAREYSVPGVVSARGATQRIRTGDLVEVDGEAGTVTLLG
ncbi:MAG: hypothetical protein LC624_04735 [Halobacteriales archaeon]|nr:hypothetical protein [Halobacteriales archaeon]